MPEDRALWEVRVGIYASEEQAEDLKERITLLLCPDPDHRPPCLIPWTTALFAAKDLGGKTIAHSGLVEQYLIETLVSQIDRGELPVGQAIPSESRLTQMYGVSRGSVRKVAAMLRRAGLLESVKGRGTFVARRDIG